MSIKHANPARLSKPTGYSHVTIASGARQLHISGQVALNANGQIVGKGDLTAQTEQVYANLSAALADAGADFSHVFKLVTYVVDLTRDKAAAVRSVRMKYLGDGPYPASTMIGITSLVDPDFLIEIEAIAAVD